MREGCFYAGLLASSSSSVTLRAALHHHDRDGQEHSRNWQLKTLGGIQEFLEGKTFFVTLPEFALKLLLPLKSIEEPPPSESVPHSCLSSKLLSWWLYWGAKTREERFRMQTALFTFQLLSQSDLPSKHINIVQLFQESIQVIFAWSVFSSRTSSWTTCQVSDLKFVSKECLIHQTYTWPWTASHLQPLLDKRQSSHCKTRLSWLLQPLIMSSLKQHNFSSNRKPSFDLQQHK